MKFKGTNRTEVAASEATWKSWRARTSPEMRNFAERLVVLIEGRVNSHTHVAALAVRAIEEADRSKLTDEQLRRVIVALYRVWAHGLSLRNWAKRKTNLLRASD